MDYYSTYLYYFLLITEKEVNYLKEVQMSEVLQQSIITGNLKNLVTFLLPFFEVRIQR